VLSLRRGYEMYPLFLFDFKVSSIFWQIFEKYSNIKFHENPSSGIRVVPSGGRRDMKISVTFRDFVNGPTNYNYLKVILATGLHSVPFLWERMQNIH
jgi:hypothetical protein